MTVRRSAARRGDDVAVISVKCANEWCVLVPQSRTRSALERSFSTSSSFLLLSLGLPRLLHLNLNVQLEASEAKPIMDDGRAAAANVEHRPFPDQAMTKLAS